MCVQRKALANYLRGGNPARTPDKHKSHSGMECCCSTDRATDSVVCPCGAAYVFDAKTFSRFLCYDCGMTAYEDPVLKYYVR